MSEAFCLNIAYISVLQAWVQFFYKKVHIKCKYDNISGIKELDNNKPVT